MAEYLNDVANMRRYCVLCGREYGPQLSNCCTHNSVVAVKRVGLIKTRVLYFTLDGRQLDEHGLALVRDKAVKALGSVGQEHEQHPSECAHEIDQGFSTSEATLTIPTEDEIGSKRPNTGTHLWLLCVILGVPLLGFLLSRGIQTHLDSTTVQDPLAAVEASLKTQDIGRV
ncbi:MAG: hypothetical protein ACUVX1_18235 [Chloroflexota bacterium]